MTPLTDETVLALLGEARPGIHAMLRRYRISPADADDVLQETMLSLVQHWPRIEAPRAWMFTVLRRQCWSCLAQRSRYVTVEPCMLGSLAGAVPSPAAGVAARLDVRRLLARLPSRQRRLIFLRYFLGMSLAEIARFQASRSPAAVSRDTQRAIVRVRELVAIVESRSRSAADRRVHRSGGRAAALPLSPTVRPAFLTHCAAATHCAAPGQALVPSRPSRHAWPLAAGTPWLR